MDGLELDNSRSTTCALGLDSFAVSALELHYSILRTCAHELDNFRRGALELDHSQFGKINVIH